MRKLVSEVQFLVLGRAPLEQSDDQPLCSNFLVSHPVVIL